MLDFIEPYLNGDEWENLCTACYRLRYKNEGFQSIPAAYCGDGGIEGFTQSGIVYQCYCPEKQYADDELYEHLRNKLSKDISKFINPDYSRTLKSLGVRNVHEWHLVVPEYKDKRILQHAEAKRKEVLEYKKTHEDQCDYICDDFVILIKIIDDFKVEISTTVRANLGVKLDFTVLKKDEIDWSKCDSEKVANVSRKVKAVMGCDDEDDDYKELLHTFLESYVTGIELLEKLRNDDIDTYENIMALEQSYKKEVSLKTRMNTDSGMNQKLFNDIMDEFQRKLEGNFPYISAASIGELKLDLISSWLADCSMQFRR
ncbi:hypothetical protein SAMN02745229_00199 [Butyrivibrio fibrisolvens DSM 3071]|uniref:Uncharacterized protein n=1 Tax=Butyrivibrio fibrisolvens DSM 3071 TaxID=1121131 RepID=A0A1M5Q4S3_BUTFI|nr:hypothetical protein [Butyrivibrio fibrisolvens]SHH09124.1 hypothetical protein SAMN02745229_00199 [Butyrivibrio fibrisolvens DSM 3071]